MNRLVAILKSNPDPQMTYQVAFCFWLLTFEVEAAKEINKSVFYQGIPDTFFLTSFATENMILLCC